jgi:hypothetical protein
MRHLRGSAGADAYKVEAKMTDLRQAAQQALDAYESANLDMHIAAIHALRTALEQQAEPVSQRSDGMPTSKTERELRRMLCVQRHSGAYMDDGEASYCGDKYCRSIDYMRESIESIKQAWYDAGAKQLAAAQLEQQAATVAWNKRIRDSVDSLLEQAGYQPDSSARHQLAMMSFDATPPQRKPLTDEQPVSNADELPSGFVPLQEQHGRLVYAACMDSEARHYKWLMWRHPDGQWVSKRKLEDWEVMQVEDQQHYGIVQKAAHGIKEGT